MNKKLLNLIIDSLVSLLKIVKNIDHLKVIILSLIRISDS
jgi:hypothetical protein